MELQPQFYETHKEIGHVFAVDSHFASFNCLNIKWIRKQQCMR